MDKLLQVETQAFLDFYDKSTPEVRESLKPLFGSQIIEYLSFRIKTYEDASNYLYGKVLEVNTPNKKSEVFTKLETIVNALNDGWDCTKFKNYFYPTFVIEDGEFKFKDVKQGTYSTTFPFSNVFKFRDAGLAKYCAEQFINMWRIFYA
jgi:hypothetical protein